MSEVFEGSSDSSSEQVKKTSDKKWVIQSTRSIGVERHRVHAQVVVGGGDGPRFGVQCTRPLDTTTYKREKRKRRNGRGMKWEERMGEKGG